MQRIHLHITDADKEYIMRLSKILKGRAQVSVKNSKAETITQIILEAKERGADKYIATTDDKLLRLLIDSSRNVSVNDYAGSIIPYRDYEFLILNPLQHLFTVNSAPHLFERYFNKFIKPEIFLKLPEFVWKLFIPADTDAWIDLAYRSSFIAVDIETGPEDLRNITCISFTFVLIGNADISASTVCIPFDDEYNIAVATTLLDCPAPKCYQNGKYDNAYLLRYGIATRNWLADTAHLFHSWYAELPKRLDFITAYLLRDSQYWKDESKTSDKLVYYGYNAKDAYNTAMSWLQLLHEAPRWAWENYYREFPVVFPCLLTELQGLRRDNPAMEAELTKYEGIIEERKKRIETLVGAPGFNPGSWQQVLRLFETLGSGDVKSSDKKNTDRVMSRHPLNKRILTEIREHRDDVKLVGGYLRDEYEEKKGVTRTKSWNGRIFFSLNPHGTDTGRCASKESAFWCGWNIQNIPRDRKDIQIKRGVVAEDLFYFGEVDYSQAEARDTAYLSGDTNLITAVDDPSRDFHGHNAAAFFGLRYEDIVDSRPIIDELGNILEYVHNTLNKAIRDLSKRTNHGANYNMGARVLLETMGIENVLRAKQLLRLPSEWDLLKVCQHLLNAFDKTYPVVRGDYQKWIIAQIALHNKLVGPTGWTRYCFGDPANNKMDLNSYVAHPSQSLNAQTLNIAYRRVFHNIALQYPDHFRLGPQIHDSILFQYRRGMECLAFEVQRQMSVRIDVTDIYNRVRTLEVPTDLKGEADRWSEVTPMQARQYGEKTFIPTSLIPARPDLMINLEVASL